jgi:hypothetical protein
MFLMSLFCIHGSQKRRISVGLSSLSTIGLYSLVGYAVWAWIHDEYNTHYPICERLERQEYQESYDLWNDFCATPKAPRERATTDVCLQAKVMLDYSEPQLQHNISLCTVQQILHHVDFRPASMVGGGNGIDTYIWITLTQTLSSAFTYIVWIGVLLALAYVIRMYRQPIASTPTSVSQPSPSSPPQLPDQLWTAPPVAIENGDLHMIQVARAMKENDNSIYSSPSYSSNKSGKERSEVETWNDVRWPKTT